MTSSSPDSRRRFRGRRPHATAIGVIVATCAIGCASPSKPKPAPPSVIADTRARADQLAADGQRLKDESVALDRTGRSAEARKRLVDGERMLTESKMLRDRALLEESPVPQE